MCARKNLVRWFLCHRVRASIATAWVPLQSRLSGPRRVTAWVHPSSNTLSPHHGKSEPECRRRGCGVTCNRRVGACPGNDTLPLFMLTASDCVVPRMSASPPARHPGQGWECLKLPSRPGEFHPEPLTEPDVILSHLAAAWDQLLIAEPEGPSFISRTVAQRRLDRRYS